MESLIEYIAKHHVVITSLLGIVGIVLLVWRTIVASRQLKTSIEIASTANKSRTDSIFANGATMLGGAEPETRLAGINTLIELADKHPEYMRSVMVSFCTFVRPKDPRRSRAHERKSAEERRRVIQTIMLWWGRDDWDRQGFVLDLRGAELSGLRLENLCFANARFDHAMMHTTTAHGVDFRGTEFGGPPQDIGFHCALSSLTDCQFDGTRMMGTIFEGVDFTGSSFKDADISGMKLRNRFPTSQDVSLGHPKDGTGQLLLSKLQLQEAEWAKDTPPDIDKMVVDPETGKPLYIELLREPLAP